MKHNKAVSGGRSLSSTREPDLQEGWFRPYVRQHRWRFSLIVLLATATLLAAAALMFTSGYLISKSATRPENILMVYVPVVLVRAFGIGRAVLHYLERLASHDTILRILSAMRVRLYRILEPQALLIRSRFRTGDMLSVLADDIEYLQNIYLRTIFPSAASLVLFAVGVIALGTFDVPFALLIALHIFILIVVLPMVSLYVTKKKQQRSKLERNALYQKLTDAVLGIGDWMISGRSQQFLESYEGDEAKLAQLESKLQGWSRWRMLLAQTVVGLVVVWMVIWTGQQTASGSMLPVMIAAFVLVSFPWMDAFVPISDAIEKVPRYQDSLQRLEKLRTTDLKEGNDKQGVLPTMEMKFVPNHDQQSKDTAHIQLNDVVFGYDDPSRGEAWTLQDIYLDLPQGKKVAMLGRSGAGKTTLLHLIQGALVPQAGNVLLNGAPIKQASDALHANIAVLNQQPHLFDTTVANNIRLGRSDATDDEVRWAAEQAQLGEMIDALPLGYQTPMQETGQRFSGGERQRIALARVLLQNTPVVILDEPTIGLDPRTERELLRTIFRSMQGKTVLWITHHLVGVEQMDEVIFLERGRIVMRGTHAELLEREARYRKLYQLDRPAILT